MFRMENAQALLGVVLVLGICWALSEQKRRFPWRTAVGALAIQVGLILVLFGLPAARAVAEAMSTGVDTIGRAANAGTQFLFGFLAGGAQPYPVENPAPLFIFAFQVLPLILVISTLSALLWHWRVLKLVIRLFGILFERTLGLGGASALSAATNIFLGNVECALVVKGYLDRLSRSELFLMMVLGMATTAGSMMVAYVVIVGQVVPAAAVHVITAAIVSAPAGILLARVMIPPDAGELKGGADYSSELRYDSTIDAAVVGISDGLNLALNIGATLLVTVALVALLNSLFGLLPDFAGQPVTVQRVLGGAFAPLAWSLGVPWKEAGLAGFFLGAKLVLTEAVAFVELGKNAALLDPRTRIIMTYALCGFANLGSVGIIVAGFGVLMPTRRKEIHALIWKSLLAGFLATCLTGATVGAMPRELFGLTPPAAAAQS